MPTRFYFPVNGSVAPVSPPVAPTWNVVPATPVRRLGAKTKTNTAMLTESPAVTDTVATASNHFFTQHVTAPLAAQTISGTLRGVMRCVESATAADAFLQFVVRVVSNDGQTVRGTLYAGSALNTVVATAGAVNQEMATSATTRVLPSTAITSVAVQDGDRLVYEYGARFTNTVATSYTVGFSRGDPAAADLAFDTTTTANTAAPWIEFSGDVLYQGEAPATRSGSATVTTQTSITAVGSKPATDLVLSTNFTGTDGSAWPAPWGTSAGNTIAANRGQQVTSATQWTDAAAQANQAVADGRFEATARFPNAAGTSMRMDVRFSTATGNGYRLIFGNDYSGFQLAKVTAWSEASLVNDNTVSWAQNTDYRIAVEFIGSTIRAKRWAVGSTEPTTWQATTTDASYTTGDVRLVTVTSTAASTTGLWDDVVLTKAAASASTVPDIPNQGRGWFHYTETHAPGAAATAYTALTASDLNAASAAGRRLVFRYVILDQFLATDTISQAFKDLLTADFAATKAAGMKLILRFTYSNSGVMTPPYNADPPVARVLTHISQLAAVMNPYADVIDGLQQGFIGMWGEQYYTDNFGDLGTLTAQNWTDRKAVVNALLDNLDSRIFVHIRYVGIKRRLAEEGMTTARLARLGYHNDAFLAPSDDYGTYHTFTSYAATQNRDWLAADTAATRLPVGGESAIGNSPTSDLANAKLELAKSRWTYLNPNYHPDVLTSWGASGRDEVGAKLGYNFTVSAPSATTSGSSVTVAFTVTNNGWAAPYRAYPVLIDFVSGATTVTRTLAADPRTWTPGATQVSEAVAAPPAGTWALHLRIVDPSASLQATTAYNIRTAGPGAYDATAGRMPLGITATTADTARSGSATATTQTSVTAAGKTTRHGIATTASTTQVTAAGTTTRRGSATATTQTSVTAAGKRTTRGSATTQTTTAITAVGKRATQGTATAQTTTAITAAGVTTRRGTATATTQTSITATGSAPTVGSKTGTATARTTTQVTAVGATSRRGAATAQTTTQVTATGTASRRGSATTQTTTSATAAGRRVTAGTATTATTTSVTAVGRTTRSGSAATTTETHIIATGYSPTVGARTGSATAVTQTTVTAEGTTTRSGSATVRTATTVTAQGMAPTVGQRTGTAITRTTTSVTAEGATERRGTAVVQTSTVITAEGVRLTSGQAVVATLTTVLASGQSGTTLRDINATAQFGPRRFSSELVQSLRSAGFAPSRYDASLTDRSRAADFHHSSREANFA